uniref:Integrase n=1 Tax=Globodera pallida TaxID=36090 RepID=A0A183CFP0_GLOPA
MRIKSGKLRKIRSDIVPVHFTDKMLSAGSDLSAERLRRAYLAHLGVTRARLIEIKREHQEKLRQTGGYTPVYEWSSEVQKHHNIIIAQWQTINMQNAADEFDAIVWRERFLDELKAKNALTVKSPAGDAEKCPCLLRGAPISRYCRHAI